MKNITSLAKYIIVFANVLLIFLMWKGCQHSKSKQQQLTDQLSKILDSVKLDSIATYLQLKEFQDTINILNAQLSLYQNKNEVTIDSLNAANKRTTTLLAKYIPIQRPLSDTGITTVSNEYVNDCADCFQELQNGQQQVLKYKAENDNIKTIMGNKISVQDNQIKDLTTQNTNLQSTIKDVTQIAKNTSNKLEQRRTLYFTLGAIAINHNYPTGVGGGFQYMDKRTRLFGVNAYISNIGPVYQVQISMPLSIKK